MVSCEDKAQTMQLVVFQAELARFLRSRETDAFFIAHSQSERGRAKELRFLSGFCLFDL